MSLQLRRGLNADRTSYVFAQGEPIYTTDTKQLYIGDGTTAGGTAVGGGGALTVDTQDFTASGTWTKPANAVWVEVTMCGAGQAGRDGTTTLGGHGGSAGRRAQKTFLAADLPSTVTVTCGTPIPWASPSVSASSQFGTYLYAGCASGGPSDTSTGESTEASFIVTGQLFGAGADPDLSGSPDGNHGAPMQPAGGGAGGDSSGWQGQASGGTGGKAATGELSVYYPARAGGGAGGASGATGVAGTAGGYDTITGFGNGGGGGGEGTAGAGGAGGAAVRGGGGGGGGKGTTTGGAGGAGGAGFVRVRTLCFG